MILFPEDIEALNRVLQERSRLDPELIDACQEHIELRQYSDAVFKAFRVLEGRVQRLSGMHGDSASRTLDRALAPDGPLSQKLGLNSRQAANLKDLLKAAFSLFRNPEAHPDESLLDYDDAECQASLAFVNLMLTILDRKPPSPLEMSIKEIGQTIGPRGAANLERFLTRAIALGLSPHFLKSGPAFKAMALRSSRPGEPPKRRRTSVFFLKPHGADPKISFSVNWTLPEELGFKPEPYIDRLKALGLDEGWGGVEFDLHLRDYHSAEIFTELYVITRDLAAELQRSLEV